MAHAGPRLLALDTCLASGYYTWREHGTCYLIARMTIRGSGMATLGSNCNAGATQPGVRSSLVSVVSTREGECLGPCREPRSSLFVKPVPRQREGTEQVEYPELAWEGECSIKLLTAAGIPFTYVSASDRKVRHLFAPSTITVISLSLETDSQIARTVHDHLTSGFH